MSVKRLNEILDLLKDIKANYDYLTKNYSQMTQTRWSDYSKSELLSMTKTKRIQIHKNEYRGQIYGECIICDKMVPENWSGWDNVCQFCE